MAASIEIKPFVGCVLSENLDPLATDVVSCENSSRGLIMMF